METEEFMETVPEALLVPVPHREHLVRQERQACLAPTVRPGLPDLPEATELEEPALFLLVAVGFLVLLLFILVPRRHLRHLADTSARITPAPLPNFLEILLDPLLAAVKSVSKSQDSRMILCSASLLHFRTPAQNSIMVLRFIDKVRLQSVGA